MTDCVIVGAGLIGMLSARELALSGLKVTLLERGSTARESSWAGGGILSPLYPWRYPDPVSELARWSQHFYLDLCSLLHEDSGIDPQWTQSGLMILDVDDTQQARQWADRYAAELELVNHAMAQELEPRLGVDTEPVAWMPRVAQVRNPRLVQSLRGALQAKGVVFRENCPVEGWVTEGGRVTGARTPRGMVQADCFVVASGAWSAGLLEPTGVVLPVEPVRGQMILFKGVPELVSRIVLYKERYVIPRRDGRILVGSTLEYVGFDKRTTEAGFNDLKQAAWELIPDLADLPIEHHWAGLRPGSPDGVPLIGVHPRLSNLYINAGHFRNGVVLGPASARLLADQMLGRVPELDPDLYLPENIIKN